MFPGSWRLKFSDELSRWEGGDTDDWEGFKVPLNQR